MFSMSQKVIILISVLKKKLQKREIKRNYTQTVYLFIFSILKIKNFYVIKFIFHDLVIIF